MGDILNYKEELTKAMTLLAEDDRTFFLGQSVRYPGQAMFPTLEGVPMEKRMEMPIFEDTQMGISIGLSLMGYIPISFFTRMDFLIVAINQLVNHLDKIDEVSHGEFRPKVIIRTMVGAKEPLDGGLQHTQDYTEGLKAMLKNVEIYRMTAPSHIGVAYERAMASGGSSVMVEYGEMYGMGKPV